MQLTAENQAPFALSLEGAVKFTGNAVSRTRLFELINKGEIDARKVGRRTVIMADSLRDFLERQPRGPNFEASERTKVISAERIAKRRAA